MYFFTADEHYGHSNILKYSNRPFDSIKEMNSELIKRHNEVVSKNDIVIHAGDFTLKDSKYAWSIIDQLNGTNIFIKGSHDRWLNNVPTSHIYEKRIQDIHIVVCHYAMRVWPRSHYNSWQLYGHSHGRLGPIGKQYDVGVDNNSYYPISFDHLQDIMRTRPNNFNLIK